MLVIPLVYKRTHHQRPLTVASKHWPIWIELFFFYSYYIFVFKHGVIWIELFLAFFFSDFQQHRDLSISVIVHLLIPQLNKFKTNWAIAFVNVYVGSCNYPSALPSQSILREFWLMTKICLDQDHLELGSFEIWCGSLRIRPYHQFWSHQGRHIGTVVENYDIAVSTLVRYSNFRLRRCPWFWYFTLNS